MESDNIKIRELTSLSSIKVSFECWGDIRVYQSVYTEVRASQLFVHKHIWWRVVYILDTAFRSTEKIACLRITKRPLCHQVNSGGHSRVGPLFFLKRTCSNWLRTPHGVLSTFTQHYAWLLSPNLLKLSTITLLLAVVPAALLRRDEPAVSTKSMSLSLRPNIVLVALASTSAAFPRK